MNVPRTIQQAKTNPLGAWRWLIFAVLVTTFAGCNLASPSSPIQEATETRHPRWQGLGVRERLLAIIPIGTSMDEAEKLLKAHGLVCDRTIDEKTGQPHLSYVHQERVGLLVQMTTSLDFECPDGKVSEITSRTIGIGP